MSLKSSEVLKPNWSTMYPLEPKGIGTPALEVLSGYMCRLSDNHWMITQHFVRKVIQPLASDDLKEGVKITV